MKKLWLFPLLLISAVAFANGPWYRAAQDYKFPSQAIMDHYKWAAPALGSTQTVLTCTSLTAGKTCSTITAQPDFPRNIVISFAGTTGSISAGNVVATGTNIYGKTVTETTAITDGTSKTGATAFKTITSVSFPATTGTNADVTYTVKAGDKLGMPRCSDFAGDLVFTIFNSAFETTRGTFVADATHVELNTLTPNGTMDGAKNFEAFYVENFRCYSN